MTSFVKALSKKIKTRNAKIGIIGLGYVGLPLLLRFSRSGFKVVGIDVDRKKIALLNDGKSYLSHIPDSNIKKALNTCEFHNAFEASSDVDFIIICVPTPLTKNREPDLSIVISSLNQLVPYLKQGQALSLESTTYPGTTEDIFLPVLEDLGFFIGNDFFLVYSPEREDPGNKNFSTKDIPKIVGGHTAECLKIGKLLYSQGIDKVVEVSSTRAAEMTKLLENIHRSVNIGLVNEMKVVADSMNIDIFEVINAAATKPFGFTPYFPGPGLGGHCIPIDPFYLTWKAREYGINTRFIELSGEINASMPEYVVSKIGLALNTKSKSIKGSKVLILGVAYKKNVEDTRESPSLAIIQSLIRRGAQVSFSDSYVKKIELPNNIGSKNISLHHKDLTRASVSSYDLVVLITDHDNFNYDLILNSSKLLIDTRGRFIEDKAKVFRA